MKCLIFSDTHGNDRLIYKALLAHKDAEVLFFLGDGLSDLAGVNLTAFNVMPIYVKGNCDFNPDAYFSVPPRRVETVELMGKRIVITHGDAFNAKYGTEELESLCEQMDADILLFGHTHQRLEQYVDVQKKYEGIAGYEQKLGTMKSYYLFNPGSAGGYDGSYGILTLTETSSLFSFGR